MAFDWNTKGCWMLLLHAHLPFVRHPEYRDSLEERWLYEAITETYIPLLDTFERLLDEGIDFRLTITLTPPLCNMLTDSLLQKRYVKYLSKLIELAEKEVQRTRYQPEFNGTAEIYLTKFKKALKIFEKTYQGNLIQGFKKFQDLGKLEIITCSATHGFLPLLSTHPNAVRGQILTAVQDYKRHFGREPRGIWNAECGYYPGLENFLKEGGIRYFYVDTHGVLHSDPSPKYGVFAPLETDNQIAFFGRDVETSQTVWSSTDGYPGDSNYREFYRDIGFDLEYDYIKPYIHESGLRISTGIKYYKITSKETPMEVKLPYVSISADNQVREHARHFVEGREKQTEYLSTLMDRKPCIVSMYDAELFGHWWYEGPDFIYHVLKNMASSKIVCPITATEYLDGYHDQQKSHPPMSSWGFKGYSEFWLNGTNDWIYPHLHHAAEKMIELANYYRLTRDPLCIRALNQASRELLLAQSSDWAFIMKTNTMVDYAIKRTKDHIGRFNRIYDMVKEAKIDDIWLRDIEFKDNIFPEIDYHVYADCL